VPTLLVVDDNPDMGELFRWYLADLDVRVVQARSAATALELARELRPEAITLDVMMPSQDGWQLLEQLRADPAIAEIPTVVCSVLPERALALSLGVAGFLAKPVTQQDLLTALSRYLRLEERAARRDSPADSASSHRR
jgi:CheY-like chemotaxis protein